MRGSGGKKVKIGSCGTGEGDVEGKRKKRGEDTQSANAPITFLPLSSK